MKITIYPSRLATLPVKQCTHIKVASCVSWEVEFIVTKANTDLLWKDRALTGTGRETLWQRVTSARCLRYAPRVPWESHAHTVHTTQVLCSYSAIFQQRHRDAASVLCCYREGWVSREQHWEAPLMALPTVSTMQYSISHRKTKGVNKGSDAAGL